MYVKITGAESDVQATEVAEVLAEAGYFVESVEINEEWSADHDRWELSQP